MSRVLLEQQEQLLTNDGDDNDGDGYNTLIPRSVILFNTWARETATGVTEDYTTKDLQMNQQRIAPWNHKYGQGSKELWCQSRSLWNHVPI